MAERSRRATHPDASASQPAASDEPQAAEDADSELEELEITHENAHPSPPTENWDATSVLLAAQHAARHTSAHEAVVLSETETTAAVPTPPAPNTIAEKKVRFVSAHEDAAIQFQKMAYRLSQVGPYIHSKQKDVPKTAVELRRRREIERVPPFTAPWQGYETSFRRLPRYMKLPDEHELRALYPRKTTLNIEWDEAHCADYNAFDPMQAPEPIKFGKLLPPDYDPKKQYPYMVALTDHRGMEVDFEDMCCHFFERSTVLQQLWEQNWVVFAPCISMRHAAVFPIEAVVARFCDWVTQNFNVENGKVHLFGKGLGGGTALRTAIEHANLAVSVVGIMGRLTTPFRPMDRPMEKVKNLNGTHVLMIVPGGIRKSDMAYKFKTMCDIQQTVPPVRAIHYADVLDHQVYYALNSYEIFNHLKFFRAPDSIMPTTQRMWEAEDVEDLKAQSYLRADPTAEQSQKIARQMDETMKEMPAP